MPIVRENHVNGTSVATPTPTSQLGVKWPRASRQRDRFRIRRSARVVLCSTHLRLARILPRRALRPRLALERDGHLYDVEALEKALGQPFQSEDPSDFRGRVVALGLAGLRELDQALLTGRRPRSAYLEGAGLLPPFDAEAGSHFQVDLRAEPATFAPGVARAVLGQDEFVGLHPGELTICPALAVVLGEELQAASLHEVRAAIVGFSLGIAWGGAGGHRVLRQTTQCGPLLLTPNELRLPSLVLTLHVGEQTTRVEALANLAKVIEQSLVELSGDVTLAGGDLVTFLLPSPSLLVREHEPVALTLPNVMSLRGVGVPRRAQR